MKKMQSVAVSIYCYLLKYRTKQKNLLPYNVTNEKFKISVKMSNKSKGKDIKSHTYYFFDDIINTKNFDPKVIQKYS